MVEAKNLGRSKAIEDKQYIQIKPYVKITTEVRNFGRKPQVLGEPIETRVAQATKTNETEVPDIRKVATWRSKDSNYDPTGHTINLG